MNQSSISIATIIVRSEKTPEELAQRLGSEIISTIEKAIELRGKAFLVVSGGSTPKPLFDYLSQQAIAWEKVCITVSDERCVDPEETSSNARLVREHLLVDHAAAAEFISLFDGGLPDLNHQVTASKRLLELPQYDFVVLGMGEDGHTASIFPKAMNRNLAQTSTQELALLTDPVTVTPLRITQTVFRLSNTRRLALHFTGLKKATLFKQVINSPNPETWPVSSFVLQPHLHLDVFCDQLKQEDLSV